MDLEALADSLVGGSAHVAASAWLARLTTVPNGNTVERYINGEAHLTATAEGVETVRRFIETLVTRPFSQPVDWYEQAIQDESLDLVGHGPEVDATLPDALCRLDTAWTVWSYLAADDKPAITHPGSLEDWLRDVVCSDAYRDALRPGGRLSSRTRSVFSTFEEDREAKFPAGTPANRCLQILGKDPITPPIAHVLFKYRRRDVGPARVPTVFDADLHPHFISPAPGAKCGTSKNLTTVDGSGGVREVVVRPVPVSMLDEPEFIHK